MSDFEARIRASIDLDKAQSELNSFLNKKYKIDIDFGNGTFSKFSTTINKEMARTGKTASAAFLKGFTSSKFKFDPIDFGKTKQKLQKEASDISKIIEKGVSGATKSDSSKWANQYITKRESEYQKIISNEEKNIAKLKRIRDKELSSKNYGNKTQEYYNKEYNRSNELTKMKTYYEQQEKLALKVEQIRKRANSGEFEYNDAKNNSFLNKYNGIDSSFVNKAKSQIKEITSLQKELQSGKYLDGNGSLTSKTLIPEDEISKANKLDDTLKKLSTTMRTVSLESSKPISSLDAISASNKTLQYLKTNTKAVKEYGAAFENLAAKQKTATTKDQLSEYSKEYKNLVSQVQIAGKTGRSFGSEFSNAFSRIGQFVGIYGVLQQGVQSARAMAKAVLDVNTSMTELRKVSTASEGELTKYFSSASNSAKKYGALVSDVISSTADWSRLGYNLSEASKLSDATTMLQRVGDNMTQESSSGGLISILKGFQLEASDVNSVVDKINEVANTQPIDTSGIVEGLQRSASSLSAAGNTIDQSISLITAANSVVQDPASVGTAYKTMSMRIRGASTELEQAGLDTEGMATSTAKLREEMQALSGIDIMKDKNTFKSTYNILDELAGKWTRLTDIQQASVTELIAGKRQGNVMSALMSNWDIAQETLNSSQNSDGSANKELGNYQKSLQYSLDKIKATAQDFSNVTLNSDFLKGAVDGAQTLLEVFTQLAGLGNGKGLLGILGAGVGTTAFLKNLDWAKPCLHTYNLLLSGSIHMENAA